MDQGKLFDLRVERNNLSRLHQGKLAEFLAGKRQELSQATKYVDLRTDFEDDQRVWLSDVLAFVREEGLDPTKVLLTSSENIELAKSVPLTEGEVSRGVEEASRYWTCNEVETLALKIRQLDVQILQEVLG